MHFCVNFMLPLADAFIYGSLEIPNLLRILELLYEYAYIIIIIIIIINNFFYVG